MPRAPLRRRQLNRNGPLPRPYKKIPNSSPARLELEKKLAHKPIAQTPNDSDDSDRLVVKGTGRRGRNVAKQEIYASGAVGKGDKPGAHPSRAQRRNALTKATNEILAQAEEEARTTHSPRSVIKEPARRPQDVNGNADKAARITARAPVSSLAMNPPASIVRSAKPTPARENSILGTLKPRRRQPSILQELEHNSSSFDLEDEEHFLPDAESTLLNPFQSPNVSATPGSKPPLVSSSKKRKLGSAERLQPAIIDASPITPTQPANNSHDRTEASEPTLPTVAISTLRRSGQKFREEVREDEDVLAPPRSSSSLSSSPGKLDAPAPPKASRKKAPKPPPTMATEELQALMMPRKRRRTARAPTMLRDRFDIAVDSDSQDSEQFDLPDEADESSFMPLRKGRKSRRNEPFPKGVVMEEKARGGTKRGDVTKQRGSAAVITSKSSTSTRHLMASNQPVLAPSTPTFTKKIQSTKSPLQPSTVNSSNLNRKRAITGHRGKGRGKSRHPGGSHRGGQGPMDGADKENIDLRPGPVAESETETRETGPTSDDALDDARHEANTGKNSIGNAGPGKWADIDAWNLDFEDVEVTTGSSGSSPMWR